MSTTYIGNYISDTIDLVSTVCVKSAASADLVNTLLMAQHGPTAVNLNDPTTWKYYLNISGQLHPTQKAHKPQVKSLDTQVMIDFTISELASNPDTLTAYQYGTKYYIALVAANPLLEQYIKGVLYPVNINAAIAAPNNSILAYSTSLVEPQEITLISKLSTWLYSYQNRWDIPSFNATDSLYQVAQMAAMYQAMVLKVLNLRLKACKTYETHSFHVLQYLASHQGIDVFVQYMTPQQQLYLYRNIAYLEHNQGSTNTLQLLIQNLLTSRNIPIASLDVKLENNFDSLAYPAILMKEINVNTKVDNGLTTTLSYDQLLAKLVNLTSGNNEYNINHHDSMLNQLQLSRVSDIGTKFLDSSMIDYNDYVRYPLATIMSNLWPYLAFKGIYTGLLTIVDPATSAIYLVSPVDAYALMWYCLMMSNGNTITTIPAFIATRVPKAVAPTVASMVALCDNKYTKAPAVALGLLANQPAFPKSTTNNNSFYALAETYYNAGVYEWMTVSRTEDLFFASQVDNMSEFMYEDIGLSNADTGTSYSTWLAARQINFSSYINPTQYGDMATEILKVATGLINIKSTSIASVQSAMISMMRLLSSYSINFISESNNSSIIVGGGEALRYADGGSSVLDDEIVDVTLNLDVTTSSVTETGKMASLDNIVSMTSEIQFEKHVFTDTTLNFSSTKVEVSNAIVNIENLTTQFRPQPIVFTDFTVLTTAQKLLVPDIYQTII